MHYHYYYYRYSKIDEAAWLVQALSRKRGLSIWLSLVSMPAFNLMAEAFSRLLFSTELQIQAEQGIHSEMYSIAAASGESSLFSLNPGIVLWTWITFALTFAILYFFAWKPILKALEQRENRIAESLENAEKVELSLKETKEQSLAMLAETRQQTRAMLDKASADAEKLKQGIEEEARNQADAIVEKAKNTIQNEKRAALQEIRSRSSDIVLGAASKLIEEKLDDAKNTELAQKYLNEMEL